MNCFSRKSVFILIGLVLLVPIIYLIWTKYNGTTSNTVENWDWKFMEEFEKNHRLNHPSYFVHTKGCRMPRFEVVDKDIEEFVTKSVEPADCGKPLIRSNNSHLWFDLNETEINQEYGVKQIDDLQCKYNSVKRITDFKNEYGKLNHTFQFGDVVKVNDEFIHIICKLKSTNKVIYRDYDFFITHKHINGNNQWRTEHQTTNKPMSVMILGLDSMSRLNFHRQMKKSADVLFNNLNAMEFFGYHKVADNTYPNLVAVLTGLEEHELNTACRPNKNETYDKCNFIWKAFKENDFVTAYAEDYPKAGIFHRNNPGFSKQATDYDVRPAFLEMNYNIGSFVPSKPYKQSCMGKRRTFDIIIDYAQKFIDAMANRIHFSFLWTSIYTHDDLNLSRHVDEALANFLRRLQSMNKLENLFLILMSDHGLRYGLIRNTYQGMLEDRQPFLFFIPPKRFSQEYPEAMRNLVKNRRALTTHFDLHATLNDLANIKMIESQTILDRSNKLQEIKPMPRGISLFLSIPDSRSCSDAAFLPHWCTCREHIELNKTDPRIIESAQLVVDYINNLLTPQQSLCEPLELKDILGGNLGDSNNQNENPFQDITVKLQTKPGDGIFESTVRIHNRNKFEVTGFVSRLNLYGMQSACVEIYDLRLYCYCKNYKPYQFNLTIQ